MKSAGKNTDYKLDPRTKLFLMLIINATVFGGSIIYIMSIMAVIPLYLLLRSGKGKAAMYCGLLYGVAAVSNELLIPITHGVINILVVMMSGMLYRLMPGFIMGYYLVTTTTVSEFVASMERLYVPQKIIIPMSVMFRFFPTIGEEARAISDAMGMRGVRFGSGRFLKDPMAMLEYRMVPLLMSTVKIGEELSAASLTRGLGNPVKRTNICKVGFGIRDIILSIVATAAFIGYILI